MSGFKRYFGTPGEQDPLADIQSVHITVDPPQSKPSAADVARIPEPVREHALVMLQLGEAAREARKRWTDIRSSYIHWLAGNKDALDLGSIQAAMEPATRALWGAEFAQAEGAATYRAQLAENNARPAGERWSPTVLALWARLSRAAQKPA